MDGVYLTCKLCTVCTVCIVCMCIKHLPPVFTASAEWNHGLTSKEEEQRLTTVLIYTVIAAARIRSNQTTLVVLTRRCDVMGGGGGSDCTATSLSLEIHPRTYGKYSTYYVNKNLVTVCPQQALYQLRFKNEFPRTTMDSTFSFSFFPFRRSMQCAKWQCKVQNKTSPTAK